MESLPSPAFLTVNELADYLRVSIRTAYQLVTDGDVPTVRVKGQWRIPVDELERWRLEGGGFKQKTTHPANAAVTSSRVQTSAVNDSRGLVHPMAEPTAEAAK